MSRLLPLRAAWVLVVLMPVQGTSTLIDGFWRPAHYHLHHALHPAVVVADGVRVMHADDIVGYLDPEDGMRVDGTSQDGIAAAQHLASGRHHHGIGDTDVVYVAGDEGDPSTPAGSRRGLDGEWNLPPRLALVLDARRVDVGFAQVRNHYCSHRSQPPLPPPRAPLTA